MIVSDPEREPKENHPPVFLSFQGRRYIKALSILLILLVGLVVRMDSWLDWQDKPYRAFHEGEPILTTVDGYFYLSLARDLVENNYAVVHEKRATPDHPLRPSPPPMLSVLVAGLAKLLPVSLNWIAVMLPVFLGMLIALPVYFLGRHFGGTFMGLSSALITLVSPYYVDRSSLGWMDTDSLLVTFVMAAAYFFLKFAIDKGLTRYMSLALGLTTWLLTMWWWDQSPHVATALILFPLLVAVVFFYRPSGSDLRIFLPVICAYSVFVLYWQGLEFPIEIVRKAAPMFNYIGKIQEGIFPTVSVSVAEQARFPFEAFVQATSGNIVALGVAITGLVYLLVFNRRESLFLAVPVVLSVVAYFLANRFLIYTAPVLGLGAGFLASRLWMLGPGNVVYMMAAPIMVLALFAPGYYESLQALRLPLVNPVYIKGMDRISQLTPENAVVWAWWDHGYPLVYWGRRATVADGSFHGSEMSVYNGLPLATSNFRLAANFMQFFVRRGLSGVHEFYNALGVGKARGYKVLLKILKNGPEGAIQVLRETNPGFIKTESDVRKWLKFFYPENVRPLYLYIDFKLTESNWWQWYGSWDIEKQKGVRSNYKTYFGVDMKNGKFIDDAGQEFPLMANIGVDAAGTDKTEIIQNPSIMSGYKKDHPKPVEYVAQYSGSTKLLAIVDKAGFNTVFNKLFFQENAPSEYFKLADADSPAYQLWQVKGDQLKRRK